jgi:hypothetical protein
MDQDQLERLGRLNRYQIAGLAILTSTMAATAVLFTLRRFLFPHATSDTDGVTENKVSDNLTVPDHFSESLTVPGSTFTGPEILASDGSEGRSPEGV